MDQLYSVLCSYANLEQAYKKARKGKTQKQYVLDFEKDLEGNLLNLRAELLFQTYRPQPLQEFIIRDPKTRKINRSAFRDRVVHHALCHVIEPLFERSFMYDSYANRKSKGAFKAVERYSYFLRKVSLNYARKVFVLKADIKQYFEAVHHDRLVSIIKKKIINPQVLWLIRVILSNYKNKDGIGMPLGNLTSQFFANVYLNELDQFVKHELRVEYYVRYVDDFVILHVSEKILGEYKEKISEFLFQHLVLKLHPTKSTIVSAQRGVDFLGMRVFLHHKLLQKKNLTKFRQKCDFLFEQYSNGTVNYDKIYDFMEGWSAYARHTNTYKLRQRVLHHFETQFPAEISTKEVNRSLPQKKK